MKRFLQATGAAAAVLLSNAAFAVGTTPTEIATAITDAGDTGKAVLISVVVGLAAIGLLSRGFSKAGVK